MAWPGPTGTIPRSVATARIGLMLMPVAPGVMCQWRWRSLVWNPDHRGALVSSLTHPTDARRPRWAAQTKTLQRQKEKP